MKRKIPQGWLTYSRIGTQVPGTRFVAFKIPLKEAAVEDLPPEDQLTVPILHELMPQIKIVIDLNDTVKYYNKKFVLDSGLYYVKIPCPEKEVPAQKFVDMFFQVVDYYLDIHKYDDSLIGVHSIHGVNRTGYMICRYLVQRLGYSVAEAIEGVGTARGHLIENSQYLTSLLEHTNTVENNPDRGNLEDPTPPPEENPTKKKKKKKKKKKQPTDSEGDNLLEPYRSHSMESDPFPSDREQSPSGIRHTLMPYAEMNQWEFGRVLPSHRNLYDLQMLSEMGRSMHRHPYHFGVYSPPRGRSPPFLMRVRTPPPPIIRLTPPRRRSPGDIRGRSPSPFRGRRGRNPPSPHHRRRSRSPYPQHRIRSPSTSRERIHQGFVRGSSPLHMQYDRSPRGSPLRGGSLSPPPPHYVQNFNHVPMLMGRTPPHISQIPGHFPQFLQEGAFPPFLVARGQNPILVDRGPPYGQREESPQYGSRGSSPDYRPRGRSPSPGPRDRNPRYRSRGQRPSPGPRDRSPRYRSRGQRPSPGPRDRSPLPGPSGQSLYPRPRDRSPQSRSRRTRRGQSPVGIRGRETPDWYTQRVHSSPSDTYDHRIEYEKKKIDRYMETYEAQRKAHASLLNSRDRAIVDERNYPLQNLNENSAPDNHNIFNNRRGPRGQNPGPNIQDFQQTGIDFNAPKILDFRLTLEEWRKRRRPPDGYPGLERSRHGPPEHAYPQGFAPCTMPMYNF